SGDIGRLDAEFAAIFGWRIGLWIPHVDVARPAAHPENDDRIQALGRLGFRFGAQQLRQAKTQSAQYAGFDKTTAIELQAIAEIRTADWLTVGTAHGGSSARQVRIRQGHWRQELYPLLNGIHELCARGKSLFRIYGQCFRDGVSFRARRDQVEVEPRP